MRKNLLNLHLLLWLAVLLVSNPALAQREIEMHEGHKAQHENYY